MTGRRCIAPHWAEQSGVAVEQLGSEAAQPSVEATVAREDSSMKEVAMTDAQWETLFDAYVQMDEDDDVQEVEEMEKQRA